MRSKQAWAGPTSVVAAAFATAGDLMLLGVASGTPLPWVGGAHPESLLVTGYYLGVLAIPLYALGYWNVSRHLAERYRSSIVALGTCGAVVGAVIHGVTGAALHAELSSGAAAAEPRSFDALIPFTAYLAPLWVIVGGALVAGSVLFAVAVARGESGYSRWLAVANPVVLVAVIGACASVSPWSRALVVPASPNVAHLLFFALASTGKETRS